MTTYNYVKLFASDDSSGGKIRIIRENFEPAYERASTLERTIEGGYDMSAGANYEVHRCIARVRATESSTDYLNLATLKALYLLNNPGGTPSNKIKYTDHWGSTGYVYIMGDFRQSILGCQIDGTEGWFLVALELRKIP